MSGHSKWSTIKHQKGVKDKRRGALFSKMAKAISIAARGGSDPDSNFKLRLVVDQAKEANVPKANIERAIARGSGGAGGEQIEEATYEGYGPGGIAVMVEVVTDNKNRTAPAIKSIFEKAGGTLASPGAVAYQFEQTGLIRVEKKGNAEETILALMDFGAEDVEEAEDAIEVFTRPEKLEEVAGKIQSSGFKIQDKELFMRPKILVEIKDKEKAEKIVKFMETLEEHDDVQKVFANFDLVV